MDIPGSTFLPLALAVIMFSLGLGLTVDDFLRIARRPKAFAVGAISQMVAIPIIAFAVAVLFRLPGELALGLMILAICPGGVTSNVLTKYARGDVALSISLTGIINLASVITVPFLVAIFAGHYLGLDAASIDVTTLGISVFVISAIPVMLGIMLRHYADTLAVSIERPLSHVSLALFALVVASALIVNWTPFLQNIAALVPALMLFNVALLATGLALSRLFGLGRSAAATISIETGIQNTALGVTVGSLIAEQAGGLPPFSLPSGVYGITMYLVSIPFVLWCRGKD